MVVRRIDKDTRARPGSLARADDSDLVVIEDDVLDGRIHRGQRLAQSGIQGVHWTVSLRNGVDIFSTHSKFHACVAGFIVLLNRANVSAVILEEFPEWLARAEHAANE